MDESSKVSRDAAADTVVEPVHIFDQTNGMMPKDDDAQPARRKKHEPTDEEIAQGTYTVVVGARGTF